MFTVQKVHVYSTRGICIQCTRGMHIHHSAYVCVSTEVYFDCFGSLLCSGLCAAVWSNST